MLLMALPMRSELVICIWHGMSLNTCCTLAGIKGAVRIKGPETLHPGAIPAGLRKTLRNAFTPPGRSRTTSLDLDGIGMSPPRGFSKQSDRSHGSGASRGKPASIDEHAEEDESSRRPSQDPSSRSKIINFNLRTLRRKSTAAGGDGKGPRTPGRRHSTRRLSDHTETVVAVDIQPADPVLPAASAQVKPDLYPALWRLW